ncbi:hypothetical protein ACH4RA_02400 [Streptomyces smyrnaeus]|uniref:hypothetical protein n=1 Tax=Streptomyces TaxID=1883 RepID=UPI0027DE3AC8|nr:hypothetical protein [Streptomyces sp. RK75]
MPAGNRSGGSLAAWPEPETGELEYFVAMAEELHFGLGRTIAILPRSLARPMHPDLVYRPVTDAPDSELVLVWAQDDHRPLVASFVAAAVEAAEATAAAAAGAT